MSLIDQEAATETLTFTVPVEVAEQLRRGADQAREPLDTYLRRLAERQADETKKAAGFSARWRAWASSSPPRGVKLDDSRESIYEGCGE